MQAFLKYLFFATAAATVICSLIANANILPGKEDMLKVFFWREQADFNALGWKFRQISVFCLCLTFVLVIARAVVENLGRR